MWGRAVVRNHHARAVGLLDHRLGKRGVPSQFEAFVGAREIHQMGYWNVEMLSDGLGWSQPARTCGIGP